MSLQAPMNLRWPPLRIRPSPNGVKQPPQTRAPPTRRSRSASWESERGYDFTPAEVLELRQNCARQLSESELDSVAAESQTSLSTPHSCSRFIHRGGVLSRPGLRAAAGDWNGAGVTEVIVRRQAAAGRATSMRCPADFRRLVRGVPERAFRGTSVFHRTPRATAASTHSQSSGNCLCTSRSCLLVSKSAGM